MAQLRLMCVLVFASQCISYSLASAAMLAEGEYDAKTDCIMVYEKVPSTGDNLYLACDGDRLVSESAPAFASLVDPAAYVANLKARFNSLVNSQGLKRCNEFSDDRVWWSFCSSK